MNPSRDPPYASFEDLAAVFREHVAPHKLAYYERLGLRLVMGARDGIWFEDAYSGRRFINCHCNGGVFNLGHRNPRVVRAVADALADLDIGNHHFPSGHRAGLAARLAATTGGALPRVVFGVSGGEAVDVAIKVARGVTGRSRIISAQGGYHGHTGLSMAAGDAPFREPFGGNLPGFVQIPFDDIAALDRELDDECAAVLLEPAPATLGMVIPAEGYLAQVRQMCTERGARLLLDEVQTGLGRTGRWWAYQHDGVTPDAVITGKGLSGGIYPITATLMTEEMHAVLDNPGNPFVHLSTFGGAELGCVAAGAVLDIVGEPGFLDRVSALSRRIAGELADHDVEMRRQGLFMGLAFHSQGEALGTLIRLLQNGVFCFPAGNDRRVIQFLPPLIIADDEVDELLRRVARALGEAR